MDKEAVPLDDCGGDLIQYILERDARHILPGPIPCILIIFLHLPLLAGLLLDLGHLALYILIARIDAERQGVQFIGAEEVAGDLSLFHSLFLQLQRSFFLPFDWILIGGRRLTGYGAGPGVRGLFFREQIRPEGICDSIIYSGPSGRSPAKEARVGDAFWHR